MRELLVLCVLGVAMVLGGCAGLGPTRVEIRSVEEGAVLSTSPRTVVYTPTDGNTADVYLTDLTRTELDPATPIDGITGTIVHVHMFLTPKAGRTPVEDTATNCTVRCLVLTGGGAVGAYQGAGFLLPRTKPGGSSFGGSMDDGSVRLIGSTAGFGDRLGASELRLNFNAERNDGLSRLIARRAYELLDLAEGRTSGLELGASGGG